MWRAARVLALTVPVWAGIGCSLFQSKPKPPGPALPGGTINLPGKSMLGKQRSQKPEAPPVIALPPSTEADGKLAVKVVAYVNNMPIFESEVREALVMRVKELEGLSDSQRERKLKELRAAELEKLIEREAILDTAFKRLKGMPGKIMEDLQREASKEFEQRMKEMKTAYKITSDEQLNAFLAQQGMSVSMFKRSMERNFISMEFMRNLVFPKIQHIPLSEIRAYYDSHPDEYTEKDRAKWQDIFIDAGKFASRAEARSYAAQVSGSLRTGADFVATSKQLQQAGYNALPGPEGIGERPGEVRPAELETAVFSLGANQVSNPIEVASGFHIIKVTDRARSGKRPFDAELQNEIRSKLLNSLANKEFRRLAEQMKENALIQRLE